jgi:hypothetical protein
MALPIPPAPPVTTTTCIENYYRSLSLNQSINQTGSISFLFLSEIFVHIFTSLVCTTEKQAVAWIQSILELVCRKGVTQGWDRPTMRKRVVGTQQRWGNVRRDREEPILDVMQEDQQPTE